MKVVVSGATGNIGTSLIRALGAQGHRPVGIARRVPDHDERDPHVRWIGADVSHPRGVAALGEALRGAGAYVHLAWPLQPMRRRDYLHRAGPETMLTCVAAALDANVNRIVHLSSVAAYRAAPHSVLVDEDWPLGGIDSSTYARHKAEGEQRLAHHLASQCAQDRVAVLRPCLVAQRDAGGPMLRLGAPALVPGAVLRHLPVVPFDRGFSLQMVHADDVAAAVVAVLERGAHGAFNLAGDGIVTGSAVAEALGAVGLPVPSEVVRAVAAAAWHARLFPIDPGWIDMALNSPLMSTERAARELGWRPRHDATQVLGELVAAMADGAGGPTPALRVRTVRDELRTGARHGSVSRRLRT